MKKLLRAFGLVLGITAPLLAGPSTPPAGSYITNVSTNSTIQAFKVSSGTIKNCLTFGDNTSQCTAGGGGGSAGAPNGSLQYNSGNAFTGVTGSLVTASSITYTGPIQASTFTSNAVILNGSSSGAVTIKPAASAGTWTFQPPTTAGSSSQFLQTDGTGVTSWQTVSGGGGGGTASLAIQQNAVNISSPTVAVNFVGPPFIVTLVNGSTSQVTLNGSSVTLQGNNVISLGSTLQVGSTFYVSSATVNGPLTVNGLTPSMPVQTGAQSQLTSAAINLNSSQISSVLQPSHGGTGISSPGFNNVFVGNNSGSYAAPTLPECNTSNNALAYDNTTQTFSCNSSVTVGTTPVNGVVNAANFSGANWVAKVNAASTALGGVGTILVPDSIAGDGSGTVGSIGNYANLSFPGSAVFTSCIINAGSYSHIYMGNASLQLSGSNCIGFNQTNVIPLQSQYKYVLQDVNINCNNQPGATGIYVGNHADTVIDRAQISGCTSVTSSSNTPTAGIVFYGTQFAQVNSPNLYNDYVGVKVYSIVAGGGGNSNTFNNLQAVNDTIGMIQMPLGTLSQGENVCVNCNFLSDTLAGLTILGNSLGSNDNIILYGGTTEGTGGYGSSTTVDGQMIKLAGIYENQFSTVYTSQFADNEATLTPWVVLTTSSSIVFTDASGGGNGSGVIASADATSSVTLQGTTAFYPPTIISGGGKLIDLRNFIKNASTNISAPVVNVPITFTSPVTSTFTYGMTASSVNVNGSGDGYINIGIGGTQYHVAVSSQAVTVNHFAQFSSTSGALIDGGNANNLNPGGPQGAVQYNNASVMTGSNNFQMLGSSVVVIGSMSVTASGVQDPDSSKGMLDLYGGLLPAGTPLLTIGDGFLHTQVIFAAETAANFNIYGASFGGVKIDQINQPGTIADGPHDYHNRIQFWNGTNGDVDIQSGVGDGNITLSPAAVKEVTVSSYSVIVSTFLSVVSGVSANYEAMFSTVATTTQYSIAITTAGHLSGGGVLASTSSCGTGAGFTGNDFNGIITPGTGAGGCTVTFSKPYKNVPSCIVGEQTMSLVNALSWTASVTALTVTQTSLTSKLNYICTGIQE